MGQAGHTSLNELIQHHLSFCAMNINVFGMDIVLHIDTLLVSSALLFLVAWSFYTAAQSLSLLPSFRQGLHEMAIECVYNEVVSASPHYIHMVGPLGFALFISIFVMNLMDLAPTSLGATVMGLVGFSSNFKLVPTADLNTTLALAVLTFFVIQINAISYLGPGSYIKGLLSHPFGLVLSPMNFMLRCIEEFSRIFSLSFRLYGNMFAGEIIFALLAVSPLWLKAVGVFSWCVFHILIIYLQAFIFMMLAVIGFGLALEH
ncbi:MAG: F0F1 ATP synthase subunit A [Gammaproteobacteria bacterium]|nr:F0F1 ATP synthase subunit A [Gammaproteobacteria bacterium]